ncbi:MAG TPA: CHAP domain-containing protein [Rhizomicrobium sp.]|nr:CHAP domain-containing protein [Rhizomicrobium sp.]
MFQVARAGILAVLTIGLTACATAAAPDLVAVSGDGASIETPEQPLQCVPYARARSGVDLYGDAANWWDLAEGHYARSSAPSIGSVLVLTGYGPGRGHLAVVIAIDSPRQIRVDHANWLRDGRIYRDDPVVDISPDNDWSQVRVWDARDNVLGSRTYAVRGFIGPDPDPARDRLASRE